MKKQNDIKECGLVVIQSFYHYFYKKWIDINYLKKISNITDKGMNVFELNNLSNKINLKIEPYQVEFSDLKKISLNYPAIVLIKKNQFTHFIILKKIKKDYFLIFDPIDGKRIIYFEEFKKIYLNVFIQVNKIINNKTTNMSIDKKIEILKVKNFFTPWIVFLSITILIFSFFSSFFMKFIFDEVIKFKNKDILVEIVIIFLIISCLNATAILLKNFVIKHSTNKILLKNYEQYLKKFDKLDYIYLSKITKTDHIRRLGILESYISFRSSLQYFTIFEILNLVASSIILFFINKEIYLISLLILFLILVINLIFNYLFKINYKKIQLTNLNYSTSLIDKIYSLIEAKKDINISNFLNNKVNLSLNQKIKGDFVFSNLIHVKNWILSIINFATPIIIVFIMVTNILNDKITFGTLLMFLSVFSFFTSPFYKFADLLSEIPIQKEHKKMLYFILSGTDENFTKVIFKEKIKSIKLENFNFFYNSTQIFKEFNINLNSNTQLIGKNGSGKSTLMKIISFILATKKDEKILINSKNSKIFNLNSLKEKIIYLYNDYYFFSCTIFEFITLNNNLQIKTWNINKEKFNLLKYFKELNLVENKIIENNGQNLSIGQKQFLILMKLFVKKYDFILLDEIFDNLDKNLFNNLKEKIKNFQNDSIFIEISHNNNYLFKEKKVLL